MNQLIEKYKCWIAELQRRQKIYEKTSCVGACLSLQGEIQAYNAVIKDLENLTKTNNKL